MPTTVKGFDIMVLTQELYKEDMEEGQCYDKLASIPEWLTGFCLMAGNMGNYAFGINHRLNGEKFATPKLEGESDEAFYDRGLALEDVLQKVASAATNINALFSAEYGLTSREIMVKAAMQALGEKQADGSMLHTYGVIGPSGYNIANDESLQNFFKSARQTLINRTLCSRQPELRKHASYTGLANIDPVDMFNKIGAAALFNDDIHSLAICVLGLAHEGQFGKSAAAMAREYFEKG